MKIFPENARVCFLGDSITHNNGFVSRISAYYHDKWKDKNISFYNCGVSGGNVETLLSIFDEDILVHHPTHAVLMIGINDSGRGSLAEPRSKERFDKLCGAFEAYKANLEKLCFKLKQNHVEIIMCTQTPYDEYQSSDVPALPGGFALMAGYAEHVRNFARANGFALCDYHRYFTQRLHEEELFQPDRVHPNDNGQYQMAKCFLDFQGLELGDKKPLPTYMDRWCRLVEIQRGLRAAEHLIVKNYSLSPKDRIKAVKQYVAEGEEDAYRAYFLKLSESYLQYKPIQTEIEAELNMLMEKAFKE